jgi:hypothetical protein
MPLTAGSAMIMPSLMHGGRTMASEVRNFRSRGNRWRVAGWALAISALLLPFMAMQFTREVNWTGPDFIFAAVMIGGVGLLFELTVRMSDNGFYRTGIALALAASFLTIWANGAVGMIGDEGNPLNLMFFGVIAIALLGSALGGFRARGMAIAMSIAAVAQVLAGCIGIATDPLGGIFSVMFAAIWLGSAAMFRKAQRG